MVADPRLRLASSFTDLLHSVIRNSRSSAISHLHCKRRLRYYPSELKLVLLRSLKEVLSSPSSETVSTAESTTNTPTHSNLMDRADTPTNKVNQYRRKQLLYGMKPGDMENDRVEKTQQDNLEKSPTSSTINEGKISTVPPRQQWGPIPRWGAKVLPHCDPTFNMVDGDEQVLIDMQQVKSNAKTDISSVIPSS